MIYKVFLLSTKMKKADCSPTFPLTTTKSPNKIQKPTTWRLWKVHILGVSGVREKLK